MERKEGKEERRGRKEKKEGEEGRRGRKEGNLDKKER